MLVLDTNVLSEVMKPSPEPIVARWMIDVRGRKLFTTATTEAEIIFGISILPDGRRKRDLELAAERVLGMFGGHILPFDSAAARLFAVIVGDCRRLGRPIQLFDAQIASITRSYGFTLATRDVRDFADAGVPLVDPWNAA